MLVFATMTLARTAAEQDLLLTALSRLAQYDRPVIVTDGGSPASFVAALEAVKGVHVLRSRFGTGLVAQIRTSMDEANRTGAAAVFYTEPDKLEFFESGVPALLQAHPHDGSRGILVAARNAGAFATFPPMQQYTERAINDLTSEVVGVAGDYSYGPFIMDASLASMVVSLTDDVGWGWRHFLFATAHRQGRPVRLHEGSFACPVDQRVEDAAERLHRVKQLEQNSRGLLLAARNGD